MRRVARWMVAMGVLAAIAVAGSPARAQSRTGFAVSRVEPAERGAGWFVVDALDLRGHLRLALGATVDYAHKPLAVYDTSQNERFALVRHQLFVHAGASIVLVDRLRLGINVPFAAYQDGESAVVAGEVLEAATAPALGDIRVAADLRTIGKYEEAFALALGLRAWVPTGVRAQFTGDGAARVGPQVLLSGAIGPLSWGARAAIVYRPRDDDYAGSRLGSELHGAAGVGARMGRLFFGPEIFASTVLTSKEGFFGTHGTPADALFGVRYELPFGLRIAAAGGTGLTRGYGSPAFRALASVEWWTPITTAPSDRDRDEIPDAVDACPDVPGVRSGDPELHGCPAPEPVPHEDTDGDGIWDGEDACPGIPGVRTSDPMTSGCPPGTPRQLAVVTPTQIRIGEQIQFATDSADVLGDSDAVLAAVKRVLDEHPEIRQVRVEGHTDDTGDPTYNDDLSRRRAAAVARWLVDRGVAQARLVTDGYGSRKPIDTNRTEDGRAKNRRVVFTILERDARP